MKVIIACDPKGGIGMEGKLPWDKLQGDLPRFKSLTDGQVVVMGKNTWLSLPKQPLPNRFNIIVSNTKLDLPDGAIQTNNINHFKNFSNGWIIGGAKLLESCWDMVETIHLSQTYDEYTCDTYIDLIKLEKEFVMSTIVEYVDHTYQIWKRR